MIRSYGHAPRGQRVKEATPQGSLANLDHAGRTDHARAGSSHDDCRPDRRRHIFLSYLEQVLCPRLRPGQIVIMDNLLVHKVAAVRELIEAAGARVVYLTPYSPDFNPIEQAWSKVKQILRYLKAPTGDTLEAAVAESFECLMRLVVLSRQSFAVSVTVS